MLRCVCQPGVQKEIEAVSRHGTHVVVPLHLRVLVSTSREREAGPTLDVVHIRDLLRPVVLVDLGGEEGLLLIGAGYNITRTSVTSA